MPATELLTWILDRGLAAGALVVCVVLGLVVRAMRADEKALHAQLDALRKAHEADMRVLHDARIEDHRQALAREVAAAKELTAALHETNDALRQLTATVNRSLEDRDGGKPARR